MIISGEDGLTCTLGNVDASQDLVGKTVKAGRAVGTVRKININTHIKYPDYQGQTTHVHFQIEGKVDSNNIVNQIKIGDKTYYNGIYLAKLGLAKLPVKP